MVLSSCTTLPTPKVKPYEFPENVFIGKSLPTTPFERVGLVRTKVNFNSLDPNHEEGFLCRNYYNKAARDLLKRARNAGADAVIELKSVVFLVSGEVETHDSPECADDGQEGQVLTQGIAVRWLANSKPLK